MVAGRPVYTEDAYFFNIVPRRASGYCTLIGDKAPPTTHNNEVIVVILTLDRADLT